MNTGQYVQIKWTILNILESIFLVIAIIFGIFGIFFIIDKNNETPIGSIEKSTHFDYYSPEISKSSNDTFLSFYRFESLGEFVKFNSATNYGLTNIYYISENLINEENIIGFNGFNDLIGNFSLHWEFDFIYYDDSLLNNFYWIEYEENNKIILADDYVENFSVKLERV